jgi:hypothetical protein
VLFGVTLLAVVTCGPAVAFRHAIGARGPWMLTYLPEMGTVSWRCDDRRVGIRAYALGFQSFSRGATEQLTLRVRNRVAFRRTIQPGQSVNLPHVDAAVQELLVSQTTEPGTLRGIVSVNFGPGRISPSHCFPWLPPAITLRVVPR